MKNSISNLNASARTDGFQVVDVPSFGTDARTGGFRPQEVPRPELAPPSSRRSKRAFDLVAATGLLILFGPLLLLIALAVRIDGGPALFGHRRLGAGGTSFRCWKFRSMVTDAEAVLQRTLANDPEARAEWDRDFKLRNDPRVTPLGNFLRKSSLDELPQLFNVHRALWPRLRRLPPAVVYMYVSHKLLRWVAAFNLGFSAILGSAGLLAMASLWAALRFQLRPLSSVAEILVALAGASLGVIHSLRGRQFQTWTPASSIRRVGEQNKI